MKDLSVERCSREVHTPNLGVVFLGKTEINEKANEETVNDFFLWELKEEKLGRDICWLNDTYRLLDSVLDFICNKKSSFS